MSKFRVTQTNPTQYDRLDLEYDGVDPKTGAQMQLVKLVGATVPQMVWFNPETRTCLPMQNPKPL